MQKLVPAKSKSSKYHRRIREIKFPEFSANSLLNIDDLAEKYGELERYQLPPPGSLPPPTLLLLGDVRSLCYVSSIIYRLIIPALQIVPLLMICKQKRWRMKKCWLIMVQVKTKKSKFTGMLCTNCQIS